MHYEQATWIRTSIPWDFYCSRWEIRSENSAGNWVSENLARILETDGLQDIPEDDDMIVF